MQTISRLLLVVPVIGISHLALGWGDQGHQIVALVAERHLTPGAQQSVAKLLGAEGGHLEHVNNLVAYATSIDQGTGPQIGAIDPAAWANESHGLARKLVRQQLRLAGLRLSASTLGRLVR